VKSWACWLGWLLNWVGCEGLGWLAGLAAELGWL